MDSILMTIRAGYSDFSGIDLKIADYVLSNCDNPLKFTVKDIADNCSTSKAAVVRFCQALGLDGFKEFKKLLISDALKERGDGDNPTGAFFDITGGETLSQSVKKIISNNLCSINETYRMMDMEALEKVIGLLDAAPRIDFYGVGASGLVAMDAQQKFARIGKNCFASLDPHVQLTMACNLKPNDVAVAISYSGMTDDVLETAQMAKDAGASLIGITKCSNRNYLHDLADVTLFTASTEISMRSGATSSRISQLTMIDAIFIGVASMRFDEYQSVIERSYRTAAKRRRN